MKSRLSMPLSVDDAIKGAMSVKPPAKPAKPKRTKRKKKAARKAARKTDR